METRKNAIGQGTRVLVTGSAGVIGRELLAELSRRGANVLSIDRLPLPMTEPAGVTHVRLDLADADLGLARSFGPEMMFHLAAAFERSQETPEFFTPNWHDNMIVSHRLAELAGAESSMRRVVFASSYLIYDPALYLSDAPRVAVALREDDRVAPRNVCGAAKFYAERELDFVREARKAPLETVAARIYRVYGRGSRDVVSRWVRAALAGEAVEVYNPENRFDYVFAGDVAEALVRLAESDVTSGIVNVGTGRGRSVAELIDAIAGRLPGIMRGRRDQGTTERFESSCADTTRLRAATGWAPPTSIEDGVAKIVEYESARARRVA